MVLQWLLDSSIIFAGDKERTGTTVMHALEIRLTHTYVGTCKHLDKWSQIGTFDVLASRPLDLEPEEDDVTEPRLVEHFAIVKAGPELYELWISSDGKEKHDLGYSRWKEKTIRQALTDAYASHGCSHEYDCCGCRSYNVRKVERVTGDLFRVEVYSYRNY